MIPQDPHRPLHLMNPRTQELLGSIAFLLMLAALGFLMLAL